MIASKCYKYIKYTNPCLLISKLLITNMFIQIVHKVHTETDDVLKSIGNCAMPIIISSLS